ncbi:hypothetical protein KIPB_001551 [Kipferlia bialata]|uniref:N-acetyltransferase domain-containing protein n=1 Tax=Kipferlia bialata TaxID=797122 RepID=A0A391NUI9_9EUKA|nr:hypothetical protein KIPB_001551 [Kipferlia bialata]|eukprot:g1551.t1
MGDQIRRATVDDLPALQALARRVIDGCYRGFLGDEGVDWYIGSGESDREVAKHIDSTDVLVREGTVLGLVVCLDDLVHLLMVDVHAQRSGAGTLLLTHATDKMFQAGKGVIHVETFKGNDRAIAFYTKNNWTQVQRTGGEEERVFFEKRR